MVNEQIYTGKESSINENLFVVVEEKNSSFSSHRIPSIDGEEEEDQMRLSFPKMRIKRKTSQFKHSQTVQHKRNSELKTPSNSSSLISYEHTDRHKGYKGMSPDREHDPSSNS